MKKIVDHLVNNYGVKVDTATTIIISITIFILGIIATIITNYILREIKKGFYRKSFRLLMESFFKACEKQYKVHNDSVSTLTLINGDDFTFKMVPNPCHGHLISINASEFITNFSSFFNSKRPKIITKLFEIVESVRLANEHYKINSKNIDDRFSKHEENYYKNLSELRKMNDEIIAKSSLPDFELDRAYPFMTKLCNIFKAYIDSKERNSIANTYFKIVSPILDEGRKADLNPFVQRAIDFCLECDISYLNLEKLEKINKENLNDLAYKNKRAFKVGKIVLKGI